jgi:hypothetical protein
MSTTGVSAPHPLNAAILKDFNADFEGNVTKADKNWPGLVAKNGR